MLPGKIQFQCNYIGFLPSINYEKNGSPMKRNLLLIIPLLSAMSLVSCIDDLVCIRGNGSADTERRRVSAFDKVENSTPFDVVFTKADTSGISVTADGNIIDNIITETYGSTLEIKTVPRDACFNYTQRPVIRISSPGIKGIAVSGSGNFFADHVEGDAVSIKLSGSGDITVQNVFCTGLAVMLSGSGSITLEDAGCVDSDVFISGSGNIVVSGESDKSNLKISGTGNIHAGNFMTGSSSVIISGSGDAYSYVTDMLTGMISGSGNIYLKGDPHVDVAISGSGRVIRNNR